MVPGCKLWGLTNVDYCIVREIETIASLNSFGLLLTLPRTGSSSQASKLLHVRYE
jgi:hypothetical protein